MQFPSARRLQPVGRAPPAAFAGGMPIHCCLHLATSNGRAGVRWSLCTCCCDTRARFHHTGSCSRAHWSTARFADVPQFRFSDGRMSCARLSCDAASCARLLSKRASIKTSIRRQRAEGAVQILRRSYSGFLPRGAVGGCGTGKPAVWLRRRIS
jgi:hypothetical protein